MKTRILHTKFWKDDFIAELNPTEKLLYLYLLLNEKVNIIHCYELTDREIQFDTGLDSKTLQIARQKFQDAGKILFFKNYVFLVNSRKYELYTGSTNDTAKDKLISTMSPEVTKWYRGIDRGINEKNDPFFYLCDNNSDRGMDRGIDTHQIPSINHNTEIINNNTEIRKEKNEEKPKKENPERFPEYLLKIPTEDVTELSKKYRATATEVIRKGEQMFNYLESHGNARKYKNFRAFLCNGLDKDCGRRPEPAKLPAYMQDPPKAEMPEITEEVRQANIKKMREMKEKLFHKKSVDSTVQVV